MWQKLRAQWVNGEQEEVKQVFKELSRHNVAVVVRDALAQSLKFKGQSGDLTDLYEILNDLIKERILL